ncbi:MAG: sigma-70 family RNA polymerase sigma factor [Planctomycetaceae bacterium]|jgi:RNA polymerase sigma-70 factor (ECF subfamily)|nr:sigma-70 family RNA polymerase sigma factor [Planctomycetaceae bacterium]
MSQPEIDQLLIESIRRGDTQAWQDFIDRFEGRLLAYVGTRLADRAHAEDIVQETFIGFLNSLPNFDCSRPLESYLFSIAAYKLTDHLRRQGRRYATQLVTSENSSDAIQRLPSGGRQASSIARSAEQKDREEIVLRQALEDQISKWRQKGDYQKLKCLEMLIVLGMSNKETAQALELSEQQVANYKSDFIQRTKTLIAKQADRERIPELDDQET